jgi:hypothetical protein
MAADVKKLLDINDQLNTEKAPYNPQWQLVSEYVGQRRADFTHFSSPGEFLNSEIWSDVAPLAKDTAASALAGLLWPDNRSYKLEPFGDFKDDEETKKWLSDCTEELQAAMDDPEAGLSLAIDEFMGDFLEYGTPAIHCEEGKVTDLRFDAWNVSQFSIDEGDDGYVDTFYKNWEWSVRQAVMKFGIDKVSADTKKAYEDKRYTQKIKILHVIAPREVDAKKGKGPQNMPYMSIYVEVDKKHILKESGFHELPTFACRYSKKIGEKYARSPSMRALPSIMELNALWELVTIGAEKNYDPPLAVYDDGTFGGGTIDTSAGAINVINVTGKLSANRSPIEQLYTVGKFDDVAVLIERLEGTIKDHYMIDRLLDLNNEKEMTAREALIRQAIRQSTLRSPANRVYAELFNRLIPRAFNILLRKGRFGYADGSPEMTAWEAVNPGKEAKRIPAKIVDAQGKNQRVYQIRYMTPAAREQEAQVAQGIMNTMEAVGQVAAYDKTILDEVNNARTIKRLGDIWSFPEDCWNTENEKKSLRESAVKEQGEQAELNKAAQVAEIAKTAAAARGPSQPAL